MNPGSPLEFAVVILESATGRVLMRQGGTLLRVGVRDSEMLYRDLSRELSSIDQVEVYILNTSCINGRWVCIARPVEPRSALPPGLMWGTVKDLLTVDGSLVCECRKIQQSRESQGFSYRHFGAFERLREWYQPILQRTARNEQRVQHWQSTDDSVLLRIEAGRDAVWLKAVGKQYQTEPNISRELSRLSPLNFPGVIATHAPNRYLIFEDVPGDTLHDTDDPYKWTSTAEQLARIQSRFIPNTKNLFDAGCADWRPAAIERSLLEFFAAMEGVMAEQISSPNKRLNREALTALRDDAVRICDLLRLSEVPDTLVHGNFSPHNVIWSKGRPVFLDWAFGIVGFPFVSIEYFSHRMARDCPRRSSWSPALLDAYYDAWATEIDSDALTYGRSLAPIAAPLIAALNLYFQQPNAWIDDSLRAAALRTLVRVFAKEVQHLPTPRRVWSSRSSAQERTLCE
jgi:Phosphotransferase enzyme family